MRRSDLLLLLISGVILVAMWIVFNIIHNSIASTITETVNQQILPINPNFDTKTINSLKTRVQISPDFQASSASATIAPSPTPVPVFISPVSSTSATTATTGGVIR